MISLGFILYSGRVRGSSNKTTYRVSTIFSGLRRIRQTKRTAISSTQDPVVVHSQMECDSHADTVVLGKNSIIMHLTNRECEVMPYTDAYDSIKAIPVVTGATGYTSPRTGQRWILVFNEALYMGEQMEHTLFNPNQLRHHGCVVQDNPYDKQPMQIVSPDGSFTLPLSSKGTTIFAETWTPTQQDLDSFPHIELTSKQPWEPRTVEFPQNSLVDQEELETRNEYRNVSAVTQTTNEFYGADDEQEETDPGYNIGGFSKRMISSVRIVMSDDAVIRSIAQVDVKDPKTYNSKERHSSVTAEDLAQKWSISVAQAAMTLKATTQRFLRSAVMPLARMYRADRIFDKPEFRAHVYGDAMDGRVKSINQNRYAYVFATKEFFVDAFPMERKSESGAALNEFIDKWGIPLFLTVDGAKETTLKNTEFMKTVRKFGIKHHVSEPYHSNENPAEGVIRELRRKWFRTMIRKKVPRCLWDFGIVSTAAIMRFTASHAGKLQGRTSFEFVTGETPDISEHIQHGFYDWVWYKEQPGINEELIGRWLGVSNSVGKRMTYYVLTNTGFVASRSTVQRITNLELQTAENIARCAEFDKAVCERFKEENFLNEGAKPNRDAWAEFMANDADFEEEFEKIVNDKGIPEADDEFTPDIFEDTYLNMELALDRGGEHPEIARVTKRMKDRDGRPIGTANENPILDTRMYEVEYLDGYKASMAANILAENMFAQVDDHGNRHVMFESIIDHRTDGNEIKQQDAFIRNKSGTERRRETTKGWEILVQFKDGSTTWVALKDSKNSFPVQTAEYAVENRISMEPAFAWWTPYVLKKRNRIIAKLKSKYWIRTHKYGIAVPKNVDEARLFDKENGNTFWWDAIVKEMKNVRPAFKVFEGTEADIGPGYQYIDCHWIFDIKLGENFRRKARLVGGGHKTVTPAAMTYSSVVSRDSVRIALTIAALNGLQVRACDIQNAYLTADCREKIWTKAGPEFGSEKGSILIVVKALYGLKSSGAAFRSLLAETLRDLGYIPSKADPDVWMRPAVKPDGFEYYEYVLCYVDDVLAISDAPLKTMQGIQNKFKLKDDKIAEPEIYLGAGLAKMITAQGIEAWTMSSDKYCQAAVANIETSLKNKGKKLPNKCNTPIEGGYRPETDATEELKADGLQFYQELIGVLRWAVEIGRVDILLEVSLMSSHLALPRIGHLEQVIHIFGYLKARPKFRLCFDPLHPVNISEQRFSKCDWTDFYGDVKEAIPGDMPEPRGMAMSQHCFVDADHAADKVHRRSHTGILIFVNRAPIIWYSKKQNSVEASTYGSEFMALKTAVELIEGLRYKLRMFGVPIEGPANVYCDNSAVHGAVSDAVARLTKKHHSIAFHRCREAVAAETIRVAKEGTFTNLADLFTKLMARVTRDGLLDKFTY